MGPGIAGPAGFRSDWNGRARLAVAKLADLLGMETKIDEFPELVLKSEGKFETDEFIEIHIFGTFDFSAVDSVRGPRPKSAMDKAIWEVVKEAVKQTGKQVEES